MLFDSSRFRESRARPSIPARSGLLSLAAVNQTSIWETCKDNDNAPCDDTVMDWLHTLNREWL